VAHPGLYPLVDANLVQALAAAGGLTEYAHRDRIFVLRPGAPDVRIRFRYDSIARSEGRAGAFRLRAGDSVIAE
jgi:polysaccharide export outer membrane protein